MTVINTSKAEDVTGVVWQAEAVYFRCTWIVCVSLSMLATFGLGCDRHSDMACEMPAFSNTTQVPVYCAYVVDLSASEPDPSEGPMGSWVYRLLVAAFADGTIMWCDDQVHGIGDQWRGQLPPSRVKAFIQEAHGVLRAEGLKESQSHVPFDAEYTSIVLRQNTYNVCLESCLEQGEQYRPDRIYTLHNSVPREGTNPEAVLNDLPQDERIFINSWRRLRGLDAKLIREVTNPARDTIELDCRPSR